jgi:hypothetical protein
MGDQTEAAEPISLTTLVETCRDRPGMMMSGPGYDDLVTLLQGFFPGRNWDLNRSFASDTRRSGPSRPVGRRQWPFGPRGLARHDRSAYRATEERSVLRWSKGGVRGGATIKFQDPASDSPELGPDWDDVAHTFSLTSTSAYSNMTAQGRTRGVLW